jgi:oligopeptidase B
MKRYLIIILFTLFFCLSCAHRQPVPAPSAPDAAATDDTGAPIPPVAKVIPYSRTVHGQLIEDEYHWLTDKTRSDPDVITYLEAENRYAERMLEHLQPAKESIFKEMLGRMKETDRFVPTKRDDYYYYMRTEEGQQYAILCRRKGNMDAPEEITLDINKLAEDQTYTFVNMIRYSPDHKYIAYTVDHTGDERYDLFVKNLKTGELTGDGIPMDHSLEWANDSRTLFYGDQNAAGDNDRIIKRHVLGTDAANDVLVFEQTLEGYSVGIEKTKDKQYLILGTGSFDSLECRYLPADDPGGIFKSIHPLEDGLEYYVSGHHHGTFYIATNADGAKNYKIMTVAASNPVKANWKEFIPHRDNVTIEEIHVFENYIVVEERIKGMIVTRIINMATGDEHVIELPEPVYSFESASNRNFETDVFRFWYSSLKTPWSCFEYHMDTRERDLLKQSEVVGGYNPDLYTCERLFATAGDGTNIPISVVYRTDMFNRDGSNPLELDAYGAYGISSDVYFHSFRLTLLDRGIVCAIAHIRGGGELGKTWHDQAKLMNKKTTFSDFISCAEYLVAQGYTKPERFVITGGSAGGTLMGAVMNMQPELFKLVFADVPSVDILNSMLDPTIPGTPAHYDELGNPNDPEMFDYMKSYCPYQNVAAQNYPNLYITNGFNDKRVNYWEAAKWTARLRRLKTDDNIIILKTEMAGHFGSSGRYKNIEDLALRYAYMFDVLGIDPVE